MAKATKYLVGINRSLTASAAKVIAIKMAAHRTEAANSPSEILRQKYSLLKYVVDFWTSHTAEFSPENSRHWSHFIGLVFDRQLLFCFRPWEAEENTDGYTQMRLIKSAIDNRQLALLRALEASDLLRELPTKCSTYLSVQPAVECQCPMAYACRVGQVDVVQFLVCAYGGTFICDCSDACHLLAAAGFASDELLDAIFAKLPGTDDKYYDAVVLDAVELAMTRDGVADITRLVTYTGPTARVACDTQLRKFMETRLESQDAETRSSMLLLSLCCLPHIPAHDENFIQLCLRAAVEQSDTEVVALVLNLGTSRACINATLSYIAKRYPAGPLAEETMILNMLLHAGADVNYNKVSYHIALEAAVSANNNALVTYLLSPFLVAFESAAAASRVLSLAVEKQVKQRHSPVVIKTLLSKLRRTHTLEPEILYACLDIAAAHNDRTTAHTLMDEVLKGNGSFLGDLVVRAMRANNQQCLEYLLDYALTLGIPLEWNDKRRAEFPVQSFDSRWNPSIDIVLRACTNINDKERQKIKFELHDPTISSTVLYMLSPRPALLGYDED